MFKSKVKATRSREFRHNDQVYARIVQEQKEEQERKMRLIRKTAYGYSGLVTDFHVAQMRPVISIKNILSGMALLAFSAGMAYGFSGVLATLGSLH